MNSFPLINFEVKEISGLVSQVKLFLHQKYRDRWTEHKFKAGYCFDENINQRYLPSDIYEALDDTSILLVGRSNKKTATLEHCVVNVLKFLRISANYRTDAKHVANAQNVDGKGVIYITELKDTTFKCPFKSCTKLFPDENFKLHIQSHQLITTLQMIKEIKDCRGDNYMELFDTKPSIVSKCFMSFHKN